MRRAERLFRIVALVRDGAVHTAADLAAALEVGERTIYRDIAHLQASGVGIDGVAGLGYIADPNLEFPPLNFTLAELDALVLGLGFTIEAADGELAAGARSALAKIEGVLPKRHRRKFAAPALQVMRRAIGRAPAIAAPLRQAIRVRELCEIAYESADLRKSVRLIRPLALTAFNEGWTLGAWCELRGTFRDFRLDRIASFRRVGQRFYTGHDDGLEAYLRHRGRRSARLSTQAFLPL